MNTAMSISVISTGIDQERNWVSDLQAALKGLVDAKIQPISESSTPGKIVFIDCNIKDLNGALNKIDRRGRAIFLVVNENSSFPELLREGKVDDMIVVPFRPMEVVSRVRYFEQVQIWNEVTEISASFSEAIKKLRENLGLAERLQKAKLPKRFPDVKGFQILSRYLAGMRSGGDYFDLAESRDGNTLSIVLSDSSSYGLSSAVLSALMRVAVKLSAEKANKPGMPTETVRLLYDDLILTLGEKDQLSLFYGTYSRDEKMLRFLSLGETCLFYSEGTKGFESLPSQGIPISRISGFTPKQEHQQKLSAGGRLALISSGFVSQLGGVKEVEKLLNRFLTKDSQDLLNEMVFQVKSKFREDEDMPARDCTVVLFEVSGKVLNVKFQ